MTGSGARFLNTGPDALELHDQLLSLWAGPPQALVNLLPDEAPIPFMIALYHQADLYLGVDSFTANLALNCDCLLSFCSIRHLTA